MNITNGYLYPPHIPMDKGCATIYTMVARQKDDVIFQATYFRSHKDVIKKLETLCLKKNWTFKHHQITKSFKKDEVYMPLNFPVKYKQQPIVIQTNGFQLVCDVLTKPELPI